MAGQGTYFGTLAVLVIAAFVIGLTVGVSIGKPAETPAGPVQVDWTGVSDANSARPIAGGPSVPEPAPRGQKKEYPTASDFLLVKPETGDTAELKDFAGSDLVLFISTTT